MRVAMTTGAALGIFIGSYHWQTRVMVLLITVLLAAVLLFNFL